MMCSNTPQLLSPAFSVFVKPVHFKSAFYVWKLTPEHN